MERAGDDVLMLSWSLAFFASCGKQAIGQASSAGPKRLPMPSDSQELEWRLSIESASSGTTFQRETLAGPCRGRCQTMGSGVRTRFRATSNDNNVSFSTKYRV